MIRRYKLEKRIFAAVNNNIINKSIEIFFAKLTNKNNMHGWQKLSGKAKVIYIILMFSY